ncbi:hypothetical protein [Chishuiella sp.]|nr:hypothetical protein [Chishuiella sp.]
MNTNFSEKQFYSLSSGTSDADFAYLNTNIPDILLFLDFLSRIKLLSTKN